MTENEVLDLLKDFLMKGKAFTDNDVNSRIFECFEKDFYIRSGATKMVLIPKDLSLTYVFKIPFTGYFSFEWDEEEDYIEYEGGECFSRPWDYCANEVIRYRQAFSAGLEDCFAETSFLKYVNGYPVYIQKRCDVFNNVYNKHIHSEEECEKTSTSCSEDLDINIYWLTDFLKYYGIDKLNTFINFIKENGWDDDLRGENIGYIKDRPVLIDYSSFYD